MKKICKNNIHAIIQDLSFIVQEQEVVLFVNDQMPKRQWIISINLSSDEPIQIRDYSLQYKLIILSRNYFYSLVLQQEICFFILLSKCLILKDEKHILRPIIAFTESILCANIHSKSYEYPEIEKILLENSKNFVEQSNEVSIFIEGIYSYSDFIQSIFLKISTELKQFLYYSHFTIQKRIMNQKTGVLISFDFKDKFISENALVCLKQSLFHKISELKLGRICVWEESQKKINLDLSNKETTVFQTLSSELIAINSLNPITESRTVTLFIYYYILAGRYFYSSKSLFLRKNKTLLTHLFIDSISSISLSILDTVSFAALENKLQKEYYSVFNRLRSSLENNYAVLLNFNSNIEIECFGFLSQLSDFYHLIPAKDKDLFFIQFIKKSFQYFFMENYYKAFIPFVVKKMTDEKI